MPLKISSPERQTAVLNRWADDIEARLDALSTTKVFAVARQAVQTIAPGIVGSGGGSVALTMPSIFSVSGNPSNPTETLIVTLNPEGANLFLGGPESSISGFDNATQNAVTGTVINPGPPLKVVTLNLNITSSTATPWAFVCSDAGGAGTNNNPAGWTSLGGNRGFAGYKSFSSSAVSFSEVISAFNGSTYNMVGCMAVFGSTPTIIQTHAPANVTTLAFTSNLSAGNTALVSVNGIGTPSAIFMNDTQGNKYTLLAFVTNSGAGSQKNYSAIFAASGVAAAADTVTVTFAGTASSNQISLMELAPIPAIPAIPTFRKLFPQDIPILGPNNIAGFDYNNLAGVALPLAFNSNTLVSNGWGSEIALADRTAQNAAIAGSTLLNPLPQTGMYRISWSATVTTAATTSSTLGGTTGFQLTYTDDDTGGSVTTPAAGPPAAGTNTAYSQTNSQNTVGTQASGVIVIRARTGTALSYNFGYASVGGTAMVYALHIRLEAL